MVRSPRDIIDGVRSGLNSLMDRIAADETPLSHVSEAALQRELERRVAARRVDPVQPMDNPRARIAGASAEARARRIELAEEREARIRRQRAERARAAQSAQEEAFRRAKAQAARSAGPRKGSTRQTASTAGASGTGRRAGGPPFQRKDDKIAEYYKVLDLPYGAGFNEVKTVYRQLMRKYHPDRHAGNPKKQKAATELSMRVTQAYNALEEHLVKK